MFSTFVTASPWDLLDGGVDDVVAYVRGELGVEGLAVWAAGPAITQIRLRPVEPRLFRTDGGFFFKPKEEMYAATRCKPILATQVKARCPIETIASACEKGGLRLRLLVSASRIGRMAKRYPEMACLNLFDSRSQDSLCLANPDVQALLVAAVENLMTQHALDSLVLSDFSIRWSDPIPTDVGALLGDRSMARALLTLCFCESCRQRATESGVDASQARRVALDFVVQSFEEGVAWANDKAAALVEKAAFAGYLRWRKSELAALLKRVAAASQCPTLIHDERLGDGVDADFHPPPDHGTAGGVIVSVSSVEDMTRMPPMAKGAQRKEASLRSSLLNDRAGAELVKILPKAASAGWDGVQFADFGSLSKNAITSVQQAVRFVRRNPTGG